MKKVRLCLLVIGLVILCLNVVSAGAYGTNNRSDVHISNISDEVLMGSRINTIYFSSDNVDVGSIAKGGTKYYVDITIGNSGSSTYNIEVVLPSELSMASGTKKFNLSGNTSKVISLVGTAPKLNGSFGTTITIRYKTGSSSTMEKTIFINGHVENPGDEDDDDDDPDNDDDDDPIYVGDPNMEPNLFIDAVYDHESREYTLTWNDNIPVYGYRKYYEIYAYDEEGDSIALNGFNNSSLPTYKFSIDDIPSHTIGKNRVYIKVELWEVSRVRIGFSVPVKYQRFITKKGVGSIEICSHSFGSVYDNISSDKHIEKCAFCNVVMANPDQHSIIYEHNRPHSENVKKCVYCSYAQTYTPIDGLIPNPEDVKVIRTGYSNSISWKPSSGASYYELTGFRQLPGPGGYQRVVIAKSNSTILELPENLSNYDNVGIRGVDLYGGFTSPVRPAKYYKDGKSYELRWQEYMWYDSVARVWKSL